jgi:hypothetical protein
MSAGPDDLEVLLGDVRKTISDNERFLRTLLEDAVDAGIESDDAEEEKVEEEFEEL